MPNNEEDKNKLIRLHPTAGAGEPILFGDQKFQGVSPDLFIYLDRGNYTPYIVTRKLNITIQIDPSSWPVEKFLQYLTTGPLEQTDKCKFHGDEDTGLAANKNLYQLLQPSRLPIISEGSQWGFLWFKVPYHFYSVGVAANPKYGAVSTRQGNDYENRSSHFEIKFKRANTKKGDVPELEYLCLNIHLLAAPGKLFGREEVLARLSAAIRLFYHELGVLRFQELDYLTLLNQTFVTTLDYHPLFSCKHPVSRAYLEDYENVKAHLRPASRQQTSAITVKRPPSPKEFQLKPDDFPDLLRRPS